MPRPSLRRTAQLLAVLFPATACHGLLIKGMKRQPPRPASEVVGGTSLIVANEGSSLLELSPTSNESAPDDAGPPPTELLPSRSPRGEAAGPDAAPSAEGVALPLPAVLQDEGSGLSLARFLAAVKGVSAIALASLRGSDLLALYNVLGLVCLIGLSALVAKLVKGQGGCCGFCRDGPKAFADAGPSALPSLWKGVYEREPLTPRTTVGPRWDMSYQKIALPRGLWPARNSDISATSADTEANSGGIREAQREDGRVKRIEERCMSPPPPVERGGKSATSAATRQQQQQQQQPPGWASRLGLRRYFNPERGIASRAAGIRR